MTKMISYPSVRAHMLGSFLALVAAPIAVTTVADDAPGRVPSPKFVEFAKPVEHLDQLAREPMVVQHPSGVLFLSGYGGTKLGERPLLWKSTDEGRTWSRVDVGGVGDGANGNSDVDLAMSRGGVLYLSTMGFDREAYEGTHVTVGVSHDVGRSWRWTYLSKTRRDDRPWVVVTRDGVAHVIWNDGDGVCHAVSKDDGSTWTERPRIHPKGGSSHMAVGPSDELAVRITPLSAAGTQYHEGTDYVAVSVDGGKNWTKHPPPSKLEWDPTGKRPDLVPRWVEPLAWGSDGALYHMWSGGSELWLARSTDLGKTWRKWSIARDDDRIFFPFLTAGPSHQLAATWFSGRDDALRANIALVTMSDAHAEPDVQRFAGLATQSWTRDGKTRDTAGEYFPAIFLRDGGLGVATTVQEMRSERVGFEWRRRRTE